MACGFYISYNYPIQLICYYFSRGEIKFKATDSDCIFDKMKQTQVNQLEEGFIDKKLSTSMQNFKGSKINSPQRLPYQIWCLV